MDKLFNMGDLLLIQNNKITSDLTFSSFIVESKYLI